MAPWRWRHNPVAGSKSILGKQFPAVLGEEVDGVDEVLGDGVGDEVVEAHPGPARLDSFASLGDLVLELVRPLDIDAEEAVAVRAGARATSARLDAEEVAQRCNDKVVMEVLAVWAIDHERQNRETIRAGVAKQLDRRVRRPCSDRPLAVRLLMQSDRGDADCCFQLEHQPGADRADDVGCTTLFAMHRVVEVTVVGGIHLRNRAPTDHVGHPIVQQRLLHDEHARGPRFADELVRADEDSVLVGQRCPTHCGYISISTYGAPQAKSHKSIAPVAPDPAKITHVSSSPPTASLGDPPSILTQPCRTLPSFSRWNGHRTHRRRWGG